MSLAVVFFVQATVRGDGPLPKFTCAGVVHQPADLKIASVSELECASVIKLEGRVQNPLGMYCRYYSPHKHVGISLALSDIITGCSRYGALTGALNQCVALTAPITTLAQAVHQSDEPMWKPGNLKWGNREYDTFA